MGFCAAGLHTRRANSGKVSVLRYLGYLLMVVAVLALAGTAAVCLFGGLAEQLRVPGSVRIIALDEAATTQAPYLRVGAKIEDLDYGRPIP